MIVGRGGGRLPINPQIHYPINPFCTLHSAFCIPHLIVPIAQNTERECPKLQVAGESPAGDTIMKTPNPKLQAPEKLQGSNSETDSGSVMTAVAHLFGLEGCSLVLLWSLVLGIFLAASHAGDHRSEAGQGRHFSRRVVHGE